MPRGELGDQVAETELFGAAARIDEDVAFGAKAREHVHAVQERAVLHEHDVGLEHGLAKADLIGGETGEGRHGRAGALRAEAREGLRVVAFHEARKREHLGGGDDALASAAMNADLEHCCFPRECQKKGA